MQLIDFWTEDRFPWQFASPVPLITVLSPALGVWNYDRFDVRQFVLVDFDFLPVI